MRKNRENQLPISPLWPDHQLAEELRVISEILDRNPSIYDPVLHDLCDKANAQTGASGMSAEQVLRCALIKQMQQFSYQKLAFHLADSQSFRVFCRLPFGFTPSKSTLQENISRIQPGTWEKINRQLVGWANQQGLERGQKIRADSTAVATDIHYPLDSRLLLDGIRVINRCLKALHPYARFPFANHERRAKRRCRNITHCRGPERRRKFYRDLLKVARKTLRYAHLASEKEELYRQPLCRPHLRRLAHYTHLLVRVIEQTERRILEGESVPAQEKIVSIFEEHSDIIRKGGREDVFGHKLWLTCGKSSLILDCQLKRGNPPDQTQVQPLLKRHYGLYGRYPRQASFDAGFATSENLRWAKQQGILDVAFAKKHTLTPQDMVRSSWIYQQLRRFRAGIEGCISTLKRVFGLDRCLWRGWQHFQQYVHLSVLAFNLVVLARLVLA